MLSRKKSKKVNILTGQKPRKNHSPKKPSIISIRYSLYALALAGVTAALYVNFKSKIPLDTLRRIRASSPLSYEIQFASKMQHFLSETEMQSISSKITALLQSKEATISGICKTIQNDYTAHYVNIFKISNNQLLITIEPRKPVLSIKASKTRLITKEGLIYGEYNPSVHGELTRLTGILGDDDAALEMADDASYITTESQKKLIAEAIELFELTQGKLINLSSIRYIPYRGFAAKTKDDGIEVLLGRSPFNKRIDRLADILINLKKGGGVATRIELDYDNKAFVKETKLDQSSL
jgi:hypothetical protein